MFKSGEEKLKFFPLLSSSNIYWTKRALKSSRIFMEQDMGGKYYFCSVFCLDYSFVYVENSQGITFSLWKKGSVFRFLCKKETKSVLGHKLVFFVKMTLRKINTNSCTTSFFTEWMTSTFLKGQSNEIFDLNFFSSFEPACATDQWVKTFSILVKFSLSYSNFNESPWGIILGRVNLPGVSYCADSISPGCHTVQSQSPGEWYPGESISRRMIPRRVM